MIRTLDAMTRVEYLEWCKGRALQYVDQGQLQNAITNLISNLGKHPDTKDHPRILSASVALAMGDFSTRELTRAFIEGFN